MKSPLDLADRRKVEAEDLLVEGNLLLIRSLCFINANGHLSPSDSRLAELPNPILQAVKGGWRLERKFKIAVIQRTDFYAPATLPLGA